MLIGEKFDIAEIARRYDLKNFLLFDCSIPYELNLDLDVYKIESSNDLINNNLLNRCKRKIIFAVTERCLENQKLPSKSSFVYNPSSNDYTTYVTDITILIEIFDGEKISEEFIGKKKTLIEIFQNAINFFAAKYNEINDGNDFLIPFAENLGRQLTSYYERDSISGKYEMKNFILSGNYRTSEINKKNSENIRNALERPYIIWKYFFNKCKYSYERYDNLDCILSAAISLEAYIESLIDKNGLRDKFNEYLKEKNKNNISYFQETQFLEENLILSKEEKDFCNTMFGKINSIRNDIVHGKIDTPILSRECAQKAKDGCVDFFEKFENENINFEEQLGKLPNEYYFSDANAFINKGYKLMHTDSFEEAINIFSENISKNMYLDYSYYNRGICFFKTNKFKEAIEDFKYCIINKFYLIESLYNKALCEIRINLNEDAISGINVILEIKNDESRLYNVKGIALNQLKCDELAIIEFNKAIELDKKAEYLYNRGISYMNLEKNDDAKNNFEEAITIEPCEKYLYEVGCWYKRIGKYQDSFRLFQMLTDICPNNKHYKYLKDNLVKYIE